MAFTPPYPTWPTWGRTRVRPYVRHFLLGLLALVLAPAHAASDQPTEYLQVSWTEKDGLSGSQISALAQDGDGYLWMATSAGLVRFDGVRFVDWLAVNPAGPPVFAFSLSPSRDGGLWLGLAGAGGVGHLLRSRLTIDPAGERGLPPGTVRSVVEDRQGTLWAVGQFGVASRRDGNWTHYGADDGVPREAAYGVHEDRRGGIWVGSDVGVFHRPPGATNFVHVQPELRVMAIADDARDTVWITGLNDPIRRLDVQPPPALRPARTEDPAGGVQLLHDSRGNIWVATLGAGAWRAYDLHSPQGPKIERFSGNRLSSDVVRAVIEDREGNIWAGTDNGLNRLTPNPLSSQPPELATISRPAVAVVRDTRGAVWAGTQNGLYRFTPEGRVRYDRDDGLPGVSIYALHVDVNGVVWAAGDHFGLARLERNRFVPVPLPPTPSLRIVALASDRAGTLYIGDADRGAFRWKDGILTDLLVGQSRKNAFAAITDRMGRVWLGTAAGVLRADPDGRLQTLAAHTGPGSGSVLTLHEDTQGTIWAGGRFGVSRFDGERFQGVPLAGAAAGQMITAIVEDDQSDLWFGLRAGVLRVGRNLLDRALGDPALSVSGTAYDMSDGLHGVPIWLGSPTATRSTDGHLWFVTATGLARIDPKSAQKHRLPPPVHIEAATADSEPVPVTPALRLAPGTSDLQIDYTGVSFTVPSKVRFRYMLEGFDRDWVSAGTRRQAFYTNLPPGSYRFRVAAENDTVWNEAGDAWEFSIAPRFYQTAWFPVLCGAVLALGAWAAWQRRVRRVREQFDLVLAERARMGREIHDTLLQSLVGVTLQFSSVASRADRANAALKHELDRLRRLLEQCIREARQSILDLRSGIPSAEELGAAIRQMAAKQTDGTNVVLDLVVSGERRPCSPRVHQQLLRIAQEAVVNAIRHAQAQNIRLELVYDAAAITLRVADDGRGFDPERPIFTPEDHWGLANMQERAEQIGAQFRLTSTPGAGTEIEAVVPLAAA
jgi:signal transduction histidine kinase/ligand-binding sensor domain-containing protein